MGKRPRDSKAQLDLFALDLQPSQHQLAAPGPAETVHLPGLLAATAQPPVATQPPAVVQPSAAAPSMRVPPVIDGDRKALTSRMSADDIAERVAETWYRQRAGDGISVCMGIMAGLTLLRKTARDGTDVATFILSLDKAELLEFHRRIWGHLWVRHPYLIDCARPIHEWLNEAQDPPGQVVDAIHAVTHTAIRSGLLHLTGQDDPSFRCDVDVLGRVLTQMRSPGARDAMSEYHTSPEVADLLAAIVFTGEYLEPGHWYDDPAAGTGGLFRAAALAMRMRGADPRQCGWSMGDLDPIASACAAVNALVWELGPNVLVWCGDTLAVGDGPARARKRRAEVLEHHEHMMSIASMAAAVKQTQILLGMVEQGAA
ncbi:hypothetical protein [Streptosporangium longisporum]|uniref:DNA methylase adenine-specific domain-containing protein n=1 Tax=Streptosporangium longisporum TaxID=46187 RepID=A0ABP6KZ71_9ACTN